MLNLAIIDAIILASVWNWFESTFAFVPAIALF
jgi:hypothetical protein